VCGLLTHRGLSGPQHGVRGDLQDNMMESPDYIDPVRVVPLIGPCQLHHAHYKCTIYFTEVTRVGWPLPHTIVDEDAAEVVYIDHEHFHMVGVTDETATSNY